jgi:UDP-N-acetylmuramoylalanine--D-glutamate ligase
VIEVDCYRGKTVAVFGLARSGISSALALAAGGATVLGWDDKEPARKAAAPVGVI